jgi:fibronectin type 3 domain-containing protein
MKWCFQRIPFLVFLGSFFLLTPSGCKFGSSQPTNPQQQQSKIEFEVPADVNADLFRVTIIIQNNDTVMYYEIAKGNSVAVDVPSNDTSLVIIDAFRQGVLISSGSIVVPSGQTAMMKIALQPVEFPLTPSGLTAVLTADLHVSLSWQTCPGVQGYSVYRTTDTSVFPVLVNKVTDPAFVDTSVGAGTTCFYRVSAWNAEGESAPSAYTAIVINQNAAPPIPQNVQAHSSGTSAITLSWNESANAASYSIYRMSQSDPQAQKVGTSIVPSYVDTGLAPQATWGYLISATNAFGESGKSALVWAAASPLTPASPQGVAAVPASGTGMLVTWSASQNATSYIVQWSTQAAGPFTFAKTDSLAYLVSGLMVSTTYFFQVIAVNDAGMSVASAQVSAATASLAGPAAPQGVNAQPASSTSIRITWSVVSGAVSYSVYRTAQGSTQQQKIGTTAVASYTDTGLAQQSTWGYAVSTVNGVGESDPSAVAWATTTPARPQTPLQVTAAGISETGIRVSWAPVQYAENYLVQWSAQASGPFASATTDTAAYVISGLAASTRYYVQVSASNSAGSSAASSPVSATTLAPSVQPPAAPILTAAARSDTSIQISWQQVQNAASYIIERAAASTGPYSVACTTAALTWTDAKLVSSTPYFYRGKAFNSAGVSGYSAVVSATTSTAAPAVPAGVTATAVSSSSITISWTAVTGATGYIIYGGTSLTSLAQLATATATTYSNTGLTAATTYYYAVAATNAGGTSAQSAGVSATTQSAAPSAPTGVTATAVSSSSITVSWAAVSGATGYVVYGGTSSTSLAQLATATATTYSNTGLTAATTYYYAVAATNAGGTSTRSTVVSAATQSAAPATPASLTATAASSSSITIKFTAVTGATSYKVYSSTNNTTFTVLATISTTTYTHTGLTANTTYYYRVTAVQSTLESPQSATVSAKTPAATKKAVITGCHGCGRCVSHCSYGAISQSGGVYVIDPAKCVGDGNCVSYCPYGCISLK